MKSSDLLRPFPGLVVDPAWADRVISGPYDAYTPEQRIAIAAANPDSFLHVTRSQEDVEPDKRNDIDGLVNESAVSLQRLLDKGVYRPHNKPTLFLYRMCSHRTEGVQTQTGIVGLIPVTKEGDRQILRHETVRADRTKLLRKHLIGVGASSSPISLTFRSNKNTKSIISDITQKPPILDIQHEGVEQTIWATNQIDTQALISAFGSPTLYVTDGHHRLAAALEASTSVKAHQTDDPLKWIQAVLFPDDELTVLPFHRLVNKQEGRQTSQLMEGLSSCGHLAKVSDAESARPKSQGSVGVYLDRSWYALSLPTTTSDRPVDSLDVSRLQNGVLKTTFDIQDPTTDSAIDYLADPLGIVSLMERCDRENSVGFVLHPTSVTELMDVADSGDLMPPKSSYFDPKPRSGIFIRYLDRERSQTPH